jgi:hypothetical protein
MIVLSIIVCNNFYTPWKCFLIYVMTDKPFYNACYYM